MDLTEAALEEMLVELAQCRIRYREPVVTLLGGERVIRNDPEGDGEVWDSEMRELKLRLGPELMAIYQAALLREELRDGCG